jgi:hypothetical protein
VLTHTHQPFLPTATHLQLQELHSNRIEAKKVSDEQVKLQDSRPLDELLSFIETTPGRAGSKQDQQGSEGQR